MSRVLLVFDDFTQLTTSESNLKKIGFDVVGISSEFSMSQQLLTFNPDIVVGSGASSRVNSVSVGRRLKEIPRWNGKTLLIFHGGMRPQPDDLLKIRMDLALEHPVSFTHLITAMAQLLGVPSETMLERWKRARLSEDDGGGEFVHNVDGGEESFIIDGKLSNEDVAQEISNLEKKEIEKDLESKNWNRELEDYQLRRGEKKINTKGMAQSTGFDIRKSLNKRSAKKTQRALRADWTEEDLKKQDELRQRFTRALFNKK